MFYNLTTVRGLIFRKWDQTELATREIISQWWSFQPRQNDKWQVALYRTTLCSYTSEHVYATDVVSTGSPTTPVYPADIVSTESTSCVFNGYLLLIRGCALDSINGVQSLCNFYSPFPFTGLTGKLDSGVWAFLTCWVVIVMFQVIARGLLCQYECVCACVRVCVCVHYSSTVLTSINLIALCCRRMLPTPGKSCGKVTWSSAISSPSLSDRLPLCVSITTCYHAH